jgi:hypothetical protein
MFTGQNTIEQTQEICLGDNYPLDSGNAVWPSPLCAWCLSEQGIPAGEGSHGICRKHADWLLLQQRKLRSRRIAAGGLTSKYVAEVYS